MQHDSGLYREFVRMLEEMRKAHALLATVAREAPGLYSLLAGALGKMEVINSGYLSAAGCNGKRMEPFVVFMVGKSKIGKSLLAGQLVKCLVPSLEEELPGPGVAAGLALNGKAPEIDVTPAFLEKDGLKCVSEASRLYTRCPGSDFWDRYTGQMAVIYDEFGQRLDGVEQSELMAMKSSATFMPAMASVDDSSVGVKGTYFTSELVVACSNATWVRSSLVSDPMALNRRRDIVALVELKPEYATDTGLLRDGVAMEVLRRFQHLNVTLIRADVENPTPLSEKLSVVDFFRITRQRYKDHRVRIGRIEKEDFFRDFHDEVEFELAEEAEAEMELARRAAEDPRVGEAQMYSASRPMLRPFEALQQMEQVVVDPCEIMGDSALRSAMIEQSLVTKVIFKRSWGELQEIKDVSMHYFRYRSNYDTRGKWIRVSEEKFSPMGYTDLLKATVKSLTLAADEFFSKHPWIKPILAGVSLTVVVFSVLYPLLKFLRKGKDKNEEEDEIAEGESELWTFSRNGEANAANGYGGEPVVRKIMRANVLTRRTGVAQVERMISPLQQYITRLERNQLVIEHTSTSPTGELVNSRMAGLLVVDRLMLVPKHFFYPSGHRLPEGSTFRVYQKGKEKPIVFSQKDYFEFPSKDLNGFVRDLAAYLLPAKVFQVSSIKNHLYSEKELMDIVNERGVLSKPTEEGQLITVLGSINVACVATKYSSPHDPHPQHPTVEFVNIRGLEYPGITTMPGDCGAVVIADRPEPKILGFHTVFVRKQKLGLAEPITREDMDMVEKRFNMSTTYREGASQMSSIVTNRPSAFMPRGNLDVIGVLPKSKAQRLPHKTQFVESPIFDEVIRHVKEPAPLHPADPRLDTPGKMLLRDSLEKYTQVTGPVYVPYFEQAVPYLLHELRDRAKYKSMGVLSLDIAVNGVQGDDNLRRVNLATAPGYGWKEEGSKGRFHLFTEVNERLYPREDLVAAVDNYILNWRNGCRVDHFWTATLKDEKLKAAKVKSGSVRSFMVGEISYLLAVKRLTGAFMANMVNARSDSFSAIGIDPESPEWDTMFKYLFAMGSHIIEGDYQQYDGQESSEAMAVCCEVINQWYDDGQEWARARSVMFLEMMHARVIAHDAVFELDHGMPSGHYLTAAVNTMVGFLYQYYAWMMLAPLPMQNSLAFSSHVRLKILGDDFIGTVTESAAEFFEMNAIASVLSELGLKVTRADKLDIPFESQTIDTCSFLKRKTAKLPWTSCVIPVLEQSSIIDMLNWIKKGTSAKEALRANLLSLYPFLTFQSPPFARVLLEDLKHALRRKGFFDFYVPSLEEINAENMYKFGARDVGVDYLKKVAFKHELYGLAVETLEAYREGEAQSESIPEPLKMPSVVMDEGVTTFHAQRPPVSKPVSMISPQAFSSHIGETSWSLAKLTEKEYVFQTLFFSTQTPSFPLCTLKVPNDFVTAYTSPVKSNIDMAFRSSTFWRGDVVVKIALNGTKFHQGMLMVNVIPYHTNQSLVSLAAANSFTGATLQTSFLDASKSTTVEVRMPYRAINPYKSCNRFDPIAQIIVQPLTALAYPTGASTSLPLTFSVHFENVEFLVPNIGIGPPSLREGEAQMEVVSDGSQPPPLEKLPAAPVLGALASDFDMHDRVYSMRDQCKRFRKLFAYTPPGTGGDPLNPLSVINGVYFDAEAAINPLYGMGIPAMCGQVFTYYRGSLRYHITRNYGLPIQVLYLPTVDMTYTSGYGLGNLPNSSMSPAELQLYATITRMLGNSQLDLAQAPGMTSMAQLSNDGLYSWHAFGSTTVVEIPYNALSSCLTTIRQTLPTSYTSRRGTIFVGSLSRYYSDYEVLTVSAAVGDDFRMGTYAGIPPFILNGYQQGTTTTAYAGNGILPSSALKNAEFEYPGGPTPTQRFQLPKKKERSKGKPTVAALRDGAELSAQYGLQHVTYALTTKTPGIPSTSPSSGSMSASTPDLTSTVATIIDAPQARMRKMAGVNVATGTFREGEAQGNTITVYNKYRKVVGSTIPTNITGDQFDLKAEGALMDKPSVPDGMVQNINRDMPLVNDAGLVPVHIMSLNPQIQATADFNLFATTEDEMSIASLAARPGLESQVDWSLTSAQDSTLMKVMVCPMARTIGNNVGFTARITPVDFVSRNCLYWAGNMKYRIQLVTSGFHTGRLWVALTYGYDPTTIAQARAQYGFIIDLSEDMRDFCIEVPYKSELPKLKVPNVYTTNLFDYAVGVLSIWVLNPLVAPPGFPATVKVNLYKSGGENFQVGFPCEKNNGWIPHAFV
jgi:hypothetical protein